MLHDLDTLPPTTPLMHYRCFRCHTRQPVGHRCGPEATLPLTDPPSLAWRIVCITLTALGLFQGIQGVVAAIQWMTGGA